MVTVSLSLAPVLFCVVVDFAMSSHHYLEKRHKILRDELRDRSTFTTDEHEVNKILLNYKKKELETAYRDPSKFPPAVHFSRAKGLVEISKVFEIIKKFPKGASLHTHMLAAVSVDFIIDNITYRDGLYGCFIGDIFKMKFFTKPHPLCVTWKSLAEYRKENDRFDGWLRQQFVVQTSGDGIQDVWKKFKGIFTTGYDMFCYRPVFQDYIYRLLTELYEDNVMYTELKGTFMPLYEANGTVHDPREFLTIFRESVEHFMKDHPAFIGARYIHSIYRGTDNEKFKASLDQLIEMKKLFPDFIAGFDFVGFEDEGRPLKDFHEELQAVANQLHFFFHAGETNWFGHTDENLVDAVLLNASRIGHGFALPKHPIVLELARERNIAVEICPISNQVLKLIEDLRDHPASHLIATKYPVVIGNDDPSIWNATGVSYDWYMVFMAMTSRRSGLEVLKQFSLDSIEYSTMKRDEKDAALALWHKQMDTFLNETIEIFGKKDF